MTAETVFFDYDAVVTHNASQAVTVRRTNAQAQKWLYIGVRNLPTARAAFSGVLTVEDAPAVSAAPCVNATAAACRAAMALPSTACTVVKRRARCSAKSPAPA